MKIKNIIALSLVSVCLGLNGCGDGGIKVSLPEYSECVEYGLEGIKQTDKIEDSNTNEEYVLSEYYLDTKMIEYIYTEKSEQKKEVSVVAQKMTIDEYNDFLPDVEMEKAYINDYECSFINRTVHVVPEDYVPNQRVQNNVEKGTTELKYDSETSIDQLLPIQRFYWFDSENDMAYSAEVIGQYYDINIMTAFVQSYMDEAK